MTLSPFGSLSETAGNSPRTSDGPELPFTGGAEPAEGVITGLPMPRSEPPEAPPLPDIVGASPAMQEVYRLTRLAAPTTASVLLIGETGTGKEVIAKAIHKLSRRSDGPYIRVNCGALHENLLESELFGHVKGAFTGAVDNKTGRFEAAHGGTIFLDEISSMSPKLQVKLLRVLQEREFERVGESRTIRVDVRVIAATNQSLEEEIEAGRFRDDLYYRLNVVPIPLPPLRERREDIPALAQFFLRRYAEQNRREVPDLTPELLNALSMHEWPGNVRELENTIERLVVLASGKTVSADLLHRFGRPKYTLRSARPQADDVPGLIQKLVRVGVQAPPPNGQKLYDHLVGGLERVLIEQVMQMCRGVQVQAAKQLGINRNTLHKKLDQFAAEDRGESAEAEPNGPADGQPAGEE
jgi:DNA-binding NtrC family response regulator